MTRRSLVHYGAGRSQVAELWRPPGSAGPVPVVVLFHGGFWRWVYTKRLMHRLAADVVRRGWAAWNVEYRRVGPGGGGGGWPSTLEDAAAAVDRLRSVEGLDLGRVATCGHSAGGQLALWCAGRRRLPDGAPGAAGTHGARGDHGIPGAPGDPDAHGAECEPVPIRTVVSLGGVVDLVEGADLELGDGAVRAFLGAGPAESPERYAVASPAELQPIGVDQLLVQGTADRVVPAALSERYAARGRQAGDPVSLVVVPGVTHTGLLDPRGPAWTAATSHLERMFRTDPDDGDGASPTPGYRR